MKNKAYKKVVKMLVRKLHSNDLNELLVSRGDTKADRVLVKVVNKELRRREKQHRRYVEEMVASDEFEGIPIIDSTPVKLTLEDFPGGESYLPKRVKVVV